MSKVVLIFTLVLLTFSSMECKNKKVNPDAKTKPVQTTTVTPPTEQLHSSRKEMDLMNIMTDCNETFRIGMSYLEQLNNSGSFPDETDKTPKCFIRCVLETSGVASEDGQFDPASAAILLTQVRGSFEANELEDFAIVCADRQETCKCERSYQFIKCVMEKVVSNMDENE